MDNVEGVLRRAPRKRGLTLVFALVALATVIVTAPASMVASLAAKSLGPRISIGGTQGSLWRGDLLAVAVDGVLLGDVAFTVSPFNLLVGAVQMDFMVGKGAANGEGRARLALIGQAFELRDARIDFNLAAIRNYTLFGAPYSGQIKADVAHLKLTRLGCSAADARIETTALSRLSQQTIGEALILSGPATCADRALAVNLSGEGAAGRADIGVVIAPDFTYELTAAVKPERSELRTALKLIGFEIRGEVMSFDVRGELKGMKS